MIIRLHTTATEAQIAELRQQLEATGVSLHPVHGEQQDIIGLIGDTSRVDLRTIESLPYVEKVMRIQEPFKKANRKFHPQDTVVTVGNAKIGGGHFAIIAGPCSVETPEQVIEVAKAVRNHGYFSIRILRQCRYVTNRRSQYAKLQPFKRSR